MAKKLPENLEKLGKDLARDTANILWIYCPCKEDWVRTDEHYDRDVDYDSDSAKAWVEEARCRLTQDYNVRASKAMDKTVTDAEDYLKNFKEGSEVGCEKHKEDPESPARGKELMREMTGALKYLSSRDEPYGDDPDLSNGNPGWKNIRYFDEEGDVSASEVNCGKIMNALESGDTQGAFRLAETLEGEREDAIIMPYDPKAIGEQGPYDKLYVQGNRRLVVGRGRVLLQQKA